MFFFLSGKSQWQDLLLIFATEKTLIIVSLLISLFTVAKVARFLEILKKKI